MPPNKEDKIEIIAPPAKKGLFAMLRNYFFAGLLVTAPIAITLYVTWGFLKFLDRKITPLIPADVNPNTYLPLEVPGLGLVVAIVFFVVVGFFTRNFFGKLLVRLFENIMRRVPVISNIYGAINLMLSKKL
jgi:uncharacterized membrane protein